MGGNTVKIKNETYEDLKKYSKKEGRKMADVVTQAVETYIKTKKEYEEALVYLVEKVKKGEL